MKRPDPISFVSGGFVLGVGLALLLSWSWAKEDEVQHQLERLTDRLDKLETFVQMPPQVLNPKWWEAQE